MTPLINKPAGAAISLCVAALSSPALAGACDPIAAGFTFSNGTTVDSVLEVVAASPLPAYCEVLATITNSTDRLSNIKVRYRLPVAGSWNSKLLGLGNGGFAGLFQGSTDQGLSKGYAVAQTDTGHSSSTDPGASFAVLDPAASPLVADHVKLEDFGHRSIHLMTLVGKEVLESFYGKSPERSYYQGCSTGGRQGAKAMQVHPEDFDGVIIGAPLLSMSRKQLWATWQSQTFHSPPTNLSSTQRRAIFDSIMGACDAKDGLIDGLLEDPRACAWHPSENMCGAENGLSSEQCLSEDQVSAVRDLYNGPVTSSGRRLYPPHMRSGELNWFPWLLGDPISGAPGGVQFINGSQFSRFMAFLDADYDFLSDFDINTVEDVAKVDSSLLASTADATDPNIIDFIDRGGKTIIYHGWLDNGFTPTRTIEYYEDVERIIGPRLALKRQAGGKTLDRLVREHARLFLIPGMHHCGGGPGPTSFDALTALERWVEKGQAPDRILGSNPDSGLSRPLCPYPLVARYRGRGDVNDASNFRCKLPKKGGHD